jgi:hypothetical protein
MKFESSEDSVVAMCTECHVGASNRASGDGPLAPPDVAVDCCRRVNLADDVGLTDGSEM